MFKNVPISILIALGIFLSCSPRDKSTPKESNSESAPSMHPTKKTDHPDKAWQSGTLDLKAHEFVDFLKSGKKLETLFQDNWTLIYHSDNRCEGSTDGQISKLAKTRIDSTISLQVKNDGDAWACEKKAPSTFDYEFNLKKAVENWDRFELQPAGDENKNQYHVLGGGDSDYIILHYGHSNLIDKLEYRSEDPG